MRIRGLSYAFVCIITLAYECFAMFLFVSIITLYCLLITSSEPSVNDSSDVPSTLITARNRRFGAIGRSTTGGQAYKSANNDYRANAKQIDRRHSGSVSKHRPAARPGRQTVVIGPSAARPPPPPRTNRIIIDRRPSPDSRFMERVLRPSNPLPEEANDFGWFARIQPAPCSARLEKLEEEALIRRAGRRHRQAPC